MSKQNKQSIQEKLQERTPTSMRQVIKPVDMLQTEQDQGDERTNENSSERSSEHTNVRTNEQRNERLTERIGERTDKRSDKRIDERKRVRHSFDIYQDQLLSLKAIAIDREQTHGKRVLLGDLVQEALDNFIEDERTNE